MPDCLFPRSARISRRALLLAPAGLALPRRVLATPVDPIAPGIAIPETAAGRQLSWVLEQVNRAARGLSLREIRDHVDPGFLAALPADQLRTLLRAYVAPNGPMSPARFEGGVTDTHACLIALTPDRHMWRIRLGTGESDPHLINALYFEPVALPAGPARSIGTWSDLTSSLRAIAPRTSFAAAELNATGPDWLSRLHGEQQLAIASAFKIYVLGAVLHQVGAGNLDWQETIAIQDEFRSLPNGDMRLLPAGMELPLQYFTERMIAGSDNTATDHLIGHLGRAQVQDSFPQMGHSHAQGNTPLLFTREWFAIRMRFRDTQIERYLAADAGKRLRILAHTVDPLARQLSEAEAWPDRAFSSRSSGLRARRTW